MFSVCGMGLAAILFIIGLILVFYGKDSQSGRYLLHVPNQLEFQGCVGGLLVVAGAIIFAFSKPKFTYSRSDK